MAKKPISEAKLQQVQNAGRKHGLYAFRDRGEDSLTAENISSLHDLRELVKTRPGRNELRMELTARLAMICWIGFSELQKEGATGNLWTSPVIRRAATYIAELRRLLDSFPDDADIIDAGMILSTLEKAGVEIEEEEATKEDDIESE